MYHLDKLFVGDVVTTSDFSRHLAFAHVCHKWKCSTYVHYIFCDPENMRDVFGNQHTGWAKLSDTTLHFCL